MNDKVRPRDVEAARRVRWATEQGFHPNAVEYARKYLNLDYTMLRLISNYENAVQADSREAMKYAFDAIITYIRTFPSQEAA